MSVFRVVEAFACATRDGAVRVLRPGDLVADDDPILKGRAGFFEPVEAAVERQREAFPVVEQATAAPGEKRAAKAPKGE